MAKQTGRALAEGCYMIIPPTGDVIPESSEIRALRKAVATGADVQFVKWGQSVDEAVAASKDAPTEREPKAEPKPRAKKAEPKDTPAVQPEPEPGEVERGEGDKPSPVEPTPTDNPSDF
jgi:hypothetical protein